MQGSALKKYAQKMLKKYKQTTEQSLDSHHRSRSRTGSIVTRKQTKTINTEQTINHQQKDISRKYYESGLRVSTVLPKLESQIFYQQKKALNQICRQKPKSRMKYDLLPLKQMEPVRLMKRSSSSSSYLSLASSRTKITDRLFSQIDNIRMAQKILLVRPTRQNTKSEHNEFFKQQQKYRKNIQVSKSVPFKSRNQIRHSKPWLNS